MLRRLSALILSVCVVLLALASPAFGQGGRSEINGTAFDQAKAVLPGVTITITEENTGLARTTSRTTSTRAATTAGRTSTTGTRSR